jgi:hypothetical protein
MKTIDVSRIPATTPAGDPTSLGRYNGFDIYPMPFFARLEAPDPAAVAAWYERALGFGVVFRGPVIHLRRMKYQDLLLVPGTTDVPVAGARPVLAFGADGEVDALARRAAAVAPVGRSLVGEPVDTPWNTRELTVVDPVGHRLVFTSRRAEPDPAAHERWRARFEAGREPSP